MNQMTRQQAPGLARQHGRAFVAQHLRCVITAAGTVEGCEVLKGLPLADAAVLAALRGRQYRPAQVAGRAVSVRHLFTIKIKR